MNRVKGLHLEVQPTTTSSCFFFLKYSSSLTVVMNGKSFIQTFSLAEDDAAFSADNEGLSGGSYPKCLSIADGASTKVVQIIFG